MICAGPPLHYVLIRRRVESKTRHDLLNISNELIFCLPPPVNLFRTAVQTPMPVTPHEWHAFSLSWWKFLLGRFPCFLHQPREGTDWLESSGRRWYFYIIILITRYLINFPARRYYPLASKADEWWSWGFINLHLSELQRFPIKIQRMETSWVSTPMTRSVWFHKWISSDDTMLYVLLMEVGRWGLVVLAIHRDWSHQDFKLWAFSIFSGSDIVNWLQFLPKHQFEGESCVFPSHHWVICVITWVTFHYCEKITNI